MFQREKAVLPIARLLIDSNPALRQAAKGVADLNLFQRVWPDIIPPPAYDHIKPACYREGTLTIWVDSPVWTNWVRHRHRLLISRIRDQEQSQKLTKQLPRVHTLIARLCPPGTARPPHVRRRSNQTTNQTIKQTAQTIADPELRGSLERLLKTLEKDR